MFFYIVSDLRAGIINSFIAQIIYNARLNSKGSKNPGILIENL